MELSCINSGVTFDNEEAYKISEDPIWAHTADVYGIFEPEVFAASTNDSVQRLKVAMAMGITTNDIGCKLFQAIGSVVAEVIITISAINAGNAGGVRAEHLSKIFRTSNEETDRALYAT